MVMFNLDTVSTQNLYQDMQKYVVIVFMKLSQINPSDKFFTKIIYIILWSNMCYVFIKDRSLQIPFQLLGPLLVILSISRSGDFDDTRQVSSINP